MFCSYYIWLSWVTWVLFHVSAVQDLAWWILLYLGHVQRANENLKLRSNNCSKEYMSFPFSFFNLFSKGNHMVHRSGKYNPFFREGQFILVNGNSCVPLSQGWPVVIPGSVLRASAPCFLQDWCAIPFLRRVVDCSLAHVSVHFSLCSCLFIECLH